MTSTDIFVFTMCAVMMLVGITIIRISKRDRGMGAVAIVIGVIGLVAYLTAEEGEPPVDTASPGVTATTVSNATPAP